MRTSRLIVFLLTAIVLVAVIGYQLLRPDGNPHSLHRVEKAIIKAQQGLPEYLQELQHPKTGQRFAVMGRFSTPNGNEFLWVKDPTLTSAGLKGTLDQTPHFAPFHLGDTVTVPKADVVDWYIRDPDGTSRGRFTESANP